MAKSQNPEESFEIKQTIQLRLSKLDFLVKLCSSCNQLFFWFSFLVKRVVS